MQSAADLFPGTTVREIIAGGEAGWSWLNPSIARGPMGYRCIIRQSNFNEKDGVYTANDPEGFVRTRNYIADLDDDLQIVNLKLIYEPDWWGLRFPWVQNVEDARLYYDRGWHYVGTLRQHREDGLPQMVRCDLQEDDAIYGYSIMRPNDGVCEKNWMPIVDTPWLIHTVSPTVLYNGTDLSVVDDTPYPRFADGGSPRGGSQLIWIDGGWLCLTHEVTWEPYRNYWHRFVMFDHNMYVKSITPRFYFYEPGIEFAAGLVEWKDNYVVSFGHRDSRAMFGTIPVSEVHARLT